MTLAEELFAAGYRVTSRRHCHVARVPPGETARAAFARHNPKGPKWDEYSAADSYRALYAERDGHGKQVSQHVMRALVKLTHAEDDILLRCSVEGCTKLRQHKFGTVDAISMCTRHAREAKARKRRR